MKLRHLIIALLMPVLAHAQYPGAYLEINSKTGVYAAGDSIKVWATVLPECDQTVVFSVEKNMNSFLSREDVSLKEGRHLMYADVCREPGVHYVFTIGKKDGNPGTEDLSAVGAIVEPGRFRSGYDAPEDLRKFWKKQIAQMRKMPLKAIVKPAPQEKKSQEGFTCLDVEIPMPEGNPVRAYVSYPSDAKPKSLPILIYAHSAGVKRVGCRSFVDKTIEDAKRGGGAIAIDINAHGMLNAQPQSYYDDLEDGELYKYSTREFTGHKDFYFRLMYLRLVRALDYLVTFPQWDGKRVAIYGESQGGAQTAFLAGIDKRVTAAVLRVPAFIDVAGPLDDRLGSWPQAYGRKAQELKDYIPYYDGACLLTMAKAKLFFEAGLADYTCPPGCVAAGYNNSPSEDKTIVFFPYRAHTLSRTDQRFVPEWEKMIMAPREKWLNDYLE